MSDTYSRLSGENSIGYALTAHAVACETCMFSHGEPPYADLPAKANCQVFTYESGRVKPERVLPRRRLPLPQRQLLDRHLPYPEKRRKQRDEARTQLLLSSVQSNHKLMRCSHCLVACS